MEVKLIDVMGDDLRVVNAARVSFSKESEWEIGTNGANDWAEILSDKDQKLIKYLARHNHFTPFTHVQITLREKVPIFVARQRFKHMVGFTYNEVSRRYVDDPPEFYTPEVWRKRAENKKQGSSDEEIVYLKKPIKFGVNEFGDTFTVDTIQGLYNFHLLRSSEIYEIMLDNEVAPEQARMVLPQSLYTEYYCTGSLAAWARAYKLRIDPHAQKEIQDLAKEWNRLIGGISELQHSWKALTSETP